ncbi:MAG: UDP-N-acetylglucosamine 2-epimerase, partial [Planctomycetes bacterium]|nr:UDP-N-acetylglucosamine 2-epimerase [Planctomycetota bacterium]
PGPIIAVTVHRRENRAYMADIASALAMIVDRHENASIVFPVHPAPAVRQAFGPILGSHPRCHLIEPLDYANFVRLLTRCDVVLTDSGGVQEEGPYLGKPVLVMRGSTERPEAVESGTARLIGQDPDHIFSDVSELLTDSSAYAAIAKAVSPYGDGDAAQRIAEILTHTFFQAEELPKSEPRALARAILRRGGDLPAVEKSRRLKSAAR